MTSHSPEMQNILSKLSKVKHHETDKNDVSYLACCPAHKDSNPSFVVTEKGNGKILMHCFSGCHLNDILLSLNITWQDTLSNEEKKAYKNKKFKPYTEEQKKEFALKRKQEEQQRNKEKEEGYRTASFEANSLYNKAKKADPLHPYLVKKCVSAPDLVKQYGILLLIPMFYHGELVNITRINPDGDKTFLKKGRVLETFCPLGDFENAKTIYIAEGFATGQTINQQTHNEIAIAVCFISANLKPVALLLKAIYGDSKNIIIAGDDDRDDKKNNGKIKALEAAEAIGTKAVFPAFPDGAPLELSDFNDLFLLQNSKS